MAEKVARRGVSIYIDGKAIPNSVRSIQQEMRKLQKEQSNLIIGSDEYVAHTRKIAQLDNILQQHKGYQAEITKEYGKMSEAVDDFEKKSDSVWSKIKNVVGDAKGAIIGFFASITVDRAIEDFAELDDAMANVRKYTGMTTDEINDLNSDLQKMDTRTSRIQLNNLAADAGRLGIQGKEGILDFVDAANILDVALGEDLGEGAVKSIGKLAQMFGDADRMGLKQAMLSTGSAINEVAQNSSAAESYLVDFTARLSGVGNQAGMSMSQLIGLGSVLDQNQQQAETSSTALSGLIMKMYQEPAKFAKIAQLDVAKFTKMVKEDANGALLELLNTLGKKGGLDALAPIFKDMNLNGARASGILSVLAGNIDLIKKEQETATQAFKDGTSVINEYDVQNNTFSAHLDKAKKVLQDYIYELGERLSPYVLEATVLMKPLVSVLGGFTSFLFDNSKAILICIGSVVAYNLILKAQNLYLTVSNTLLALSRLKRIQEALATTQSAAAQVLYNNTVSKGNLLVKSYAAATALLTTAKFLLKRNVEAASIAFRNFTAIISVNPYVALLVAIPLLFAGMTMLTNAMSGQSAEVERLRTKNKNAAESINSLTQEVAKEHTALSGLLQAIIQTSEGTQIRKDLIADLKKEYPDLLKFIDTEKLKNDQLYALLRMVNEQYEKRYELAALQGLTSAEDQEIESAKARQIQIKRILNLIGQGYQTNSAIVKDSLKKLNEGNGWFSNDIDSVEELNAEYNKLGKIVSNSMKVVSEYREEMTSLNTDMNKINTKDGLQELMNLKAIELQNQRESVEMLNKSDAISEKSKNKAIQKLKQLEAEYDILADKMYGVMTTEEKKVPDSTTAPIGSSDKSTAQRKRINDALRLLEEQHLKNMSEIKSRYLSGDIKTEEEFNQEILKQQDVYDQNRKKKLQELLKSITDPSLRIDIAKQIADIDAKAYDRQISDMEKRRKALAKWNDEETKKIVQASLKDVDAQESKAEQELAILRAKNEISDVEYRNRLLENEKKFLEKRLRINGLTEEEITKIKQQLDKNTGEQDIEHVDARTAALDKYGLVSLQSQKEQELALIKYYEDQGILTHDEAIKARIQADQNYLEGLTSKVSEVNSQVQAIGGNLSGTMTNFASAEESAVSRKYDKQIAAAEGNSKKQKKLEEKKQKELNEIKAKYADKQFAVTTAMTIASTAQAAMEAYKAMAGIPIVGPALGAIAAGAAIAYGASQIAVAKEQRDAAKEGYYKGGYYIDEGYTGGGDPKQVRGYLPDGSPVHGQEFIANHATTSVFKPLFDVFDEAQKHNTVSSISKRDLAKALNISHGYYQGGYSGTQSSIPTIVRNSQSDEVLERVIDVMDHLDKKLDNIRAYVTYKGDDGIEDAQILDSKMKKNVSR